MATASALISDFVPGSPIGALIDSQLGPVLVVLGVLASLVRQSDSPPARIRFGSLGSSTNGAMNSAFRGKGGWSGGGGMASGMRKGGGFQSDSPSSSLKNWPLM